MTNAVPWPSAFAGTPALEVIERGISRGRLGHSILLHGEDSGLLGSLAEAIADRLLRDAKTSESFSGADHPDCFVLRPAGKMRIISADATRELIDQVHKTASVGARKVAIIFEADRMNLSAANLFLKTLEEPPRHTTILLVSTRPYALLPTIRSRCLHFRFSGTAAPESEGAEAWKLWRADYIAWLGRLSERTPDRAGVADPIFALYGLITRFSVILREATEKAWEKQKGALPEDLEEEETVAIETSLAVGLRTAMFGDIAAATRDFAQPRLAQGEEHVRRSFIEAIENLEKAAGLLRLNLNELAALEDFLLSSMRIWTRK